MARRAGNAGGRSHLGVGGEYRPQGLALDQHDARQRFFGIPDQVQPEVFGDLRAVYVTVQEAPELWHVPNVPDELRQWGTRWHLTDPWCWDVARELFAKWDAERKGEPLATSYKTHSVESFIRNLAAVPGFVLGTSKFDSDNDLPPEEPVTGVGSISIPGWLIFNETEKTFRARAVQQFHQELEAHIERAIAAARDRGAIMTSIEGAALETHLIWLARATVKGERSADIWKSLGNKGVRAGKKTVATRGGLTRRAVEKAIQEAADLIGLTLPKR
jgi:hypothetical protein